MNLWGKNWTREELRPHVGRLQQVAGVTRYELQNGFERGVEMLEVRTGSGLRFGVCPSRGLDITFAEHNGRSLAWQSATGWRHPAYYSADNLDWLRGFGGGLMTTCGFGSFGPPCEEDGEKYGLHDRASYLPAENVNVSEVWDGDDYVLFIEGSTRETRVFGPNLMLKRRISARAGDDRISVQDTLTNDGFRPVPAVILYHCNFGFPVVSENSRVQLPTKKVTSRDQAALEGETSWMQLEAPQPGYAERVYFHEVEADANGRARAGILNEELKFGAYVEYSPAQLPNFTQWKCMAAGDYVCGLEPSNAPLATRSDLRAQNALPMLAPGESLDFHLEFGIL